MKSFTIMIYEDGCNELEYEIDKRYKDLIKEKANPEINIVIQTSKLNREIAKLLRPTIDFTLVEDFVGCRRYNISNNTNILIENLGATNMADPKALKEFIIWAVKEFPSYKYILIIGGHGFEFVGMITDYSQNMPFIMGFPQLSKALAEACSESKIAIDILILDTCYANNIETFYELGKNKEEYIKYLITYTFWGNIKGVSYKSVLQTLNENIQKDTDIIVYKLSEELIKANAHFPIISAKLDYIILDSLKRLYSTLALLYLTYKKDNLTEFSPLKLLYPQDSDEPWYFVSKNIHELSKLMVIYDGDCVDGGSKLFPIKILYRSIKDKDKQLLYSHLSFSNNNYWFNLLCNLDLDKRLDNPTNSFLPIPLSKNILFAYISSCNYNLSLDDIWNIINSLIELSNWNL